MLVLFSDIHLTDGTSGETVNQEAFDLFADQVAELARRRRAAEVHLVLLGDGLDVLRSSRWLDHYPGPRPWSRPGRGQEAITAEIIEAILDHNAAALDHLADLPRRVAARTRLSRDDVHFDYVLGNHDWLINQYPSTRRMVVERLDLPSHYVDRMFPQEFRSPAHEYDTVARHGDRFDGLNCDALRGPLGPTLGDAIVVELLNRFPLEVQRELADHPARQEIVLRLKEIDNVRPYAAICSWLNETIRELSRGDRRVARAARVAMVRCAEDFLGNAALWGLAARRLPWVQRQYLRLALNRLRRHDLDALDSWSRLVDRAWKVWRLLRDQPSSEYAECAAREKLGGSQPRFVVYGHSHEVETVPLGPSALDGSERFYINTGTWRTVWEKAAAGNGSGHFSAWKVMSYAAIYSPLEGRGHHEFELWHGRLRDSGDACGAMSDGDRASSRVHSAGHPQPAGPRMRVSR